MSQKKKQKKNKRHKAQLCNVTTDGGKNFALKKKNDSVIKFLTRNDTSIRNRNESRVEKHNLFIKCVISAEIENRYIYR